MNPPSKKSFLVYLACFGLLALGLSQTANAEVAVIVNPANSVSSMSTNDVTQIFTGSKSSFPDGSKAEPVNNKSDVNDEFLSRVLNKTSAQLKAAWARIVFSGKGQEPKALGDSNAVKKFVASNPKAIGYIESSAVDGTVKVVLKAN